MLFRFTCSILYTVISLRVFNNTAIDIEDIIHRCVLCFLLLLICIVYYNYVKFCAIK